MGSNLMTAVLKRRGGRRGRAGAGMEKEREGDPQKQSKPAARRQSARNWNAEPGRQEYHELLVTTRSGSDKDGGFPGAFRGPCS